MSESPKDSIPYYGFIKCYIGSSDKRILYEAERLGLKIEKWHIDKARVRYVEDDEEGKQFREMAELAKKTTGPKF